MSAYQDGKTAAAHLGVSPSPALALLVLFLGVITSSIAVVLLINTPVFLPSLSNRPGRY
jgi:hypothetical protein